MKRVRVIWVPMIFIFAVLACEQEGDQNPPGKIQNLTFFTDPKALEYNGDQVQLGKEHLPAKTYSLAWTATGDNGDEGKAALYDLRFISEAEVKKYGLGTDPCHRESEFLHPVFNEPYPKSSGKLEIYSLLDLNLRRGAKYHFCLWALDEIGQASEPADLEAQIPFLGLELTNKKDPVPGLGEKTAGLGDFDGKGLTDVSVSSPAQGKVLIYLGRRDQELYWRGEVYGRRYRKVRTLWPKLHISGDPAESFGFAVTKLGDVNKNHTQDIAISGPDAPNGRVYLFRYFHSDPLTSANAWSVIEGEAPGDRLGFALADCNDLNLDSYPDFAVSAPNAGKVYVVMGGSASAPLGPIPSGGSISTIASVEIKGNPASGFGSALACGSDLNGDAIPDLLVSADQENAGQGAVYLFLGGPQKGVMQSDTITARNLQIQIDLTAGDQSDLKISGANPGENFGGSVAMVGDIWRRSSADFSRDFAVGAGGIGTGRIYLFFGGVHGNLGLDQITPPSLANASQADLILDGKPGEIIGGEIAGKGDLNQDRHFDLAAGNGIGGVRVYYLLPAHNPDKIKSRLFKIGDPITSFQIITGFSRGGEAGLLIGSAGRNRAYLLK